MSKAKLELVRYSSVPAFQRKRRSRPASASALKAVSKLKTCSGPNAITANNSRPMLPDDIEVFDNQVAGHMYQHGKSIGMLKQNGKVLKTTTKPMCAEREMRFYEELQTSTDPVLQTMKGFTPGYHGTKQLPINGQLVDCIVLDDITSGLREPCVMDVKIGKRTWDPLATDDKIKNEQEKYVKSKRDVGFCIPGFQVKNITDGKTYRFGKDYGKNLDGDGIREALRIFLNGQAGFNRPLLIQLLGFLWRILHWCRTQRKLRIYSSSILLTYDARFLRNQKKSNGSLNSSTQNSSENLSRYKLNRPMSLAINHSNNEETKDSSPGFSGQFTSDGIPKLERSMSANASDMATSPSTENLNSPWKKTFKKLQRNHSFNNNYEEELKNLKRNYVDILDNLLVSSNGTTNILVNVKMIDFAHVFPSEGNSLDTNYLEGIENLVSILESFLEECK